MTEADIKPLLKPLVNGQAYPYVVKLTAEGKPAVSPPWIVYSLPSDTASDVFCGQAETESLIQVDIYADTIDEASALRIRAKAAIEIFSPAEVRMFKEYEPDTGLYRASFEFKVWQ